MAACHPASPGPARDASPIRTDSVVYHLSPRGGGYQAIATATYRNRTSAPMYYARCGEGPAHGLVYGRRRTGADSTRALFSDELPVCGAGMAIGVLPPGDSLTVPVRLGSLPQPSMQPSLRLEDLTGLQRVVFRLCDRPVAASDDCAPLPLAGRQSNAFDVRP